MITKLCQGSGFVVESSRYDTTNIICKFGHIYADGARLVASLDAPNQRRRQALKKLGDVIMDEWDKDEGPGCMSVKADPRQFRAVCTILKPIQKSNLAAA